MTKGILPPGIQNEPKELLERSVQFKLPSFKFIVDMMEGLRPDLVAPVVLWLCHEECPDSGSVIEAAAGWVGKCNVLLLVFSSFGSFAF